MSADLDLDGEHTDIMVHYTMKMLDHTGAAEREYDEIRRLHEPLPGRFESLELEIRMANMYSSALAAIRP